jgi:hypothetical protein
LLAKFHQHRVVWRAGANDHQSGIFCGQAIEREAVLTGQLTLWQKHEIHQPSARTKWRLEQA